MNELIIIHLVVGFTAALPAILMRFVNTEKPNMWFGYRTPSSLKSEHTWKFANEFSSKAMIWVAVSTILTQIFLFFTLDNKEGQILISSGVMTIGLIIVLALTESKMSNLFDKDGNPKHPEADKF
ncbi:MAG TPA: SdpI family protein [Roseivirga sp.]